MSFQPPSAKQEQQNRKVLEEVYLKKKLMLKQQATSVVSSPPTNSSAATSNATPAAGTATLPPQTTPASATEYQGLQKNQRAALLHAHANSFANFITQDSSFEIDSHNNRITVKLPKSDHSPFCKKSVVKRGGRSKKCRHWIAKTPTKKYCILFALLFIELLHIHERLRFKH